MFMPPFVQQPGPESPEAVHQRLRGLYQASDWGGLAEAIEALSPAQRGKYLAVWLQALEKAKRWEKLAQVCEGVAAQLDPQKQAQLVADLSRKRLHALVRLERWGEALLLCEGLGDQGETIQFLAGADYARTARDYAAMERLARKWIGRQPAAKEGPGLLGEALSRQERFAEAEPLLRQAVQLLPKDGDAWCNLGRCLNERKAWAEALEALDKAVELDPKRLEARYNRGRTRFELGRYGESAEDFEAALGMAPEDPVLKENLRQARRYQEAQSRAGKGAR